MQHTETPLNELFWIVLSVPVQNATQWLTPDPDCWSGAWLSSCFPLNAFLSEVWERCRGPEYAKETQRRGTHSPIKTNPPQTFVNTAQNKSPADSSLDILLHRGERDISIVLWIADDHEIGPQRDYIEYVLLSLVRFIYRNTEKIRMRDDLCVELRTHLWNMEMLCML